MTSALRACLATAILAALVGASPERDRAKIVRLPPAAPPYPSASAGSGLLAVPCPSGSLPDGEGCVPFEPRNR
ncbi:MAG: hypothetical protein RMJ98_00510 [Myxococcales bacterium]|nr:hypothetical protein [Polyangiaceae bacterium]MDW8247768.1 hypothetical protein [Myxococcales bacterium]